MAIQRSHSQGTTRADASSPTSSATTPQEKVTSTTRATAHSTTARRSAPPSSAQASHRRRTRSRSARHAQDATSPTPSERSYNARMEKIRGNSNKSSLVTCLICNDSLLGDADQGDAIKCLTCTARFHSKCIYTWMEISGLPLDKACPTKCAKADAVGGITDGSMFEKIPEEELRKNTPREPQRRSSTRPTRKGTPMSPPNWPHSPRNC